ncbi:MAG: TonB-dependent receptor [Gemmatimonadota bacterium]|nr:MAG: TonB-dependent receptor [Gemmatimonadota bacterium]
MHFHNARGVFTVKHRFFPRYVSFIVALFVFTTATFAQDFGTVRGRIHDAHTGDPLPNANVVLGGTKQGAVSGAQGLFTINRVPPGEYRLQATYVGYEADVRTITVTSDEDVFVHFDLREDFFQIQEIVVTATRTDKLMEDVPVVTEIVTRAEIEEKGAEDLSEVLEDRPGIAIESGTTGNRFLYMNGVDSRRILVLVDNVPLSGKLNNRVQLNVIDADKIDHVEIVKGPGSALYGSDAMGGVINIITKDYGQHLIIETNGRAGSNDLYSGNLSVSGGKKDLNYLLNIDHFREGFDQGASEIEIEKTLSSSVNGKARYTHPDIGNLEVRGEYRQDEQTSESAFMGGISDNRVNIENVNSSFVWNRAVSGRLQLQLTGYYADNFRTYESLQQGSASLDTTTDELYGFKSDFAAIPLEKVKVDFGFDLSSNDYENERLPGVQSRQQTGAFTQVETDMIRNLTLTFGGRYDKITDIEGYFSPRMSAMYTFSSGLKLRGSYGAGFRAPSFIELYSDFPIPIPGMPLRVVGNPDLKPEKSLGGNLGFEYRWNSLLLVNATAFHNKFKDMIVDYESGPMTYSYLNVESATFKGTELQARLYLLPNFTTTLSYNFTDIAQKEEDVAFSKISPHTASLRIVYGLLKNRLKFSLRNQWFSERDILAVSGHSGNLSRVKKDAHNEIDMTLSYTANEYLRLRLGATNLTDHTDKDYGPYVGRRFFFGFQTTFQKD